MAGSVPTSSNEHHCVPRSFLGSNHAVNLTRINEVQHTQFHRIMGHTPPDFMLRDIILSSINWHEIDGRKIPFDWYQKIMEAFSLPDWRSFYLEEAFRETDDLERQTLLQTAVHIRLQLLKEQQKTIDAIRALMLAEYLQRPTVEFSMNAMLLFNAPRPVDTIHAFLTDLSERGELKWSSSMKPAQLKKISNLTRGVETEQVPNGYSGQLIALLDQHNLQLCEWMNSWQLPHTGGAQDLDEYAQQRINQRKRRNEDPYT